jgi:hypothetical protein
VPDSIDRPAVFARSLDALRTRVADSLDELAYALDTTAQLARAHAARRTDHLDASTRETELQREHRAQEYAQRARENAQTILRHPQPRHPGGLNRSA